MIQLIKLFNCFPVDPSVSLSVEHREEKVAYTFDSNDSHFYKPKGPLKHKC